MMNWQLDGNFCAGDHRYGPTVSGLNLSRDHNKDMGDGFIGEYARVVVDAVATDRDPCIANPILVCTEEGVRCGGLPLKAIYGRVYPKTGVSWAQLNELDNARACWFTLQ
jgi:hypothetical protein